MYPKDDENILVLARTSLWRRSYRTTGKKKTVCLEMRFLDSYKFTLKPLDSLVKTLGEDQFETLTSQMCGRSRVSESTERKGVFPYEYMTDFSKLSATSLPPERSVLQSAHRQPHPPIRITIMQRKVWSTFNAETMRDYHDRVLKDRRATPGRRYDGI